MQNRRRLLWIAFLFPLLLGCSSAAATPTAAADASSDSATTFDAPFDSASSFDASGTQDAGTGEGSILDASPTDASNDQMTVCEGGPAFAAAVDVSKTGLDDFSDWEVSIAAHEGVTVAAWISSTRTNLLIRSATSVSGGPFSTPQVVPLHESYGDPTVGFSSDGVLYIASICDIAQNLTPGDICVVFSTDNGQTFSPSFRASDPPSTQATLRDRPWLAVAPDGRIVITYFDAQVDSNLNTIGPASLRYVVGTRSGDTMTFTPSAAVYVPPDGDAGANADAGGLPSLIGYSGTLASDAQGTLHVVYQIAPPNNATVAPLVAHARFAADLSSVSDPTILGQGALPVVAASGTAGEIAVASYTGDFSGIAVYRSHDGGDHFDPPAQVSSPSAQAVYVPWISGDEVGDFHVVWDDLSAMQTWVVHYAHVPLGGAPEAPLDLSSPIAAPTQMDQRYLGDFIGVATDHGRPRVAWGQPVNGVGVVRARFASCP